MSGDWYTQVSGLVDGLAHSAKSGFTSIQDSLADLTTSLDKPLFGSHQQIFNSVLSTPPPPTYYEQATTWLAENKYVVLGVTGATGAGAYYAYTSHTKKNRKRRAARTGNASRKEVLIITNFTTSAVSKSVALDLERRGFIIFCACQTLLEKLAIENEGHADIRPLLIRKGESPYAAIEQFGSYLSIPAPAYHGGHTLHLAGLILTSPVNLATGPLEVIDQEQMLHATEVGISWPTAMLQYFLPLLREHSGRIVCLNDWIIPSLHTPFYAPAVTTAHALESLAKTVSREIPSLLTIHMRLGTFDLAHHQSPKNATRADVLGWSPAVRATYGSSYKNCTGTKSVTTRVKGSPIKELHHAVFDALTDNHPAREVNVGAGVRLYQWIANVMPELALRYLLGIGIATGEEDWEVVDQS